MNIARKSHSSCVVKSKLFVFGGSDKNSVLLDSIEVLDLGAGKVWDLLTIPEFTARSMPIVSPV